MSSYCPQCGAPVAANAVKCDYCNAPIANNAQPVNPVVNPVNPAQPQVVVVQNGGYNERANWPIKNKLVAGLLAILLGGIGVHKFYLGESGKGVLYLLLCWTGIPAIIGLIEGITILTSTDENFQIKYRCRIG